MKKYLIVTLAMVVLGSVGSAFAQPNSANHELRVRIPDLLMLRITNGTTTAPVAAPVVNFNFVDNGSGLAAYMAMVQSGTSADLAPTYSNFGNVLVLANRVAWTVDVEATDFDYTDDVVSDGAAEGADGLVLGDISVTPTGIIGADGLSTLEASFGLSSTPQDIATGTRTQGWTALGIGGDAYRINVDGDEAPGTYVTTVTYTITAP